MPNRYSQYVSQSNYSPESFKDMAVVPIALRQRHDNALAAQDDLLMQLNNIQVQPEMQGYLNDKRLEITGKINQLTDKINTVGAGDMNVLGEFRNMKRDYNKEVSLSGGIGRAANLKQTIDKSKANFMEFNSKQGFSPETGEANYQKYYKDYMSKIDPNNIGDSRTIIPDFNPVFAPKLEDPSSVLHEVKDLIGQIGTESSWQNFKIEPDSEGIPRYIQVAGKTLNKSNEINLQKINDVIKNRILNPNSSLRQSIKWANPNLSDEETVKQFTKEFDPLLESMIDKTTAVANQQEPIDKNTSGSHTKTGNEDEPANLVSTQTGQETFEGKSMIDILNGLPIKEIEDKEKNGTVTQDDINNKNLAIQQKYRIEKALKNPSIPLEINTYLKQNGSIPNGSIDKYKNIINQYQSQIENIKKTPDYQNAQEIIKNSNGRIDISLKGNPQAYNAYNKVAALNEQIQPLKSELDDAFKKSIPTDDLKYSKKYTFGFGEGSKKAMDTFNANANDYGSNWVNQIQNAGGLFTLPGDTELHDNKDSNKLNELKQAFSEGTPKFTIGSIIDSGSTGSSQIEMNYTTGTGEKAKSGRIVVDYDNKSTDTSALDNMLTQIQKTLDPRSQAIIQSIMDNKQLSSISVDNKEYGKSGFSKTQNNTIKLMSNAVTDSRYKNNDTFKSVNYNSVPGREYNIILNDKGYNDLYMRDANTKNVTTLSTQNWLKKELTKEYIDKTFKNSNPLQSQDPFDKRKLVETMKDFALNLTDSDGLIQVDDNSPKYQKLRAEYLRHLNENSNDINLQHQLTLTFFNELQNMKISHKNKKRLL